MPLKTSPPQSSQGLVLHGWYPLCALRSLGKLGLGMLSPQFLGFYGKEGFVQGLALYALCKSAVARNQEIAPGDAVCA